MLDKKWISPLLGVLSLPFLILGLYEPIFHLKINAGVKALTYSHSADILNQSRSILATVSDLFNDQRYLVAILIFIFSVINPACKSLAMLFVFFKERHPLAPRIYRISSLIGKWSMADVFVVAILLSYLATKDGGVRENFVVKAFGMQIPAEVSTTVYSSLGPGFYYFTCFCILSILSVQFYKKSLLKVNN